jgi:hypothetical protein
LPTSTSRIFMVGSVRLGSEMWSDHLQREWKESQPWEGRVQGSKLKV